MSLYSLPNYIVSIYTLFVGCFTLLCGPKVRKNHIFFLITLFSFIWLFFYGLSYSLSDYQATLAFLKIGHQGAVLLSPTIYYLTLEVLQSHKKQIDIMYARLSILLCLACSVLIYTSPLYFKGISKHRWGYYPVGGPLMILYALFTFALALRVIYLLLQASKNAQKEFKFNDYQKFKYHSISVIIFVFAAMDYLPKFGVKMYPFGYFFVGMFSSISTYAIVRHKLFDIDIVIRRSFFYSFLISSLTLIYLLIILASEYIFRSFFGYRSILIAFIVSSIIALTFTPLRLFIQRIIDKYFFKIDPEKIIKENALMKDELQKQDRLRAIATLASGMAHEIKNPLVTIRTFAEYLPKKYEDPEFREKFKNIVMGEVDRVSGILTQLLDFSKPQPPKLELLQINAILNETLDPLSNSFLKNRITLEKKFTEDKIVSADRNQIKQVFLNLFLNSIQAMPEGGTLTVNASASSDSKLLITISDTGCGIPNEQLPHVFEPFFTTKELGTGLGLFIVKEIIDAHGGKIWAESKVNAGTQIHLSFPNALLGNHV